MTVEAAHTNRLSQFKARAGSCCGIAALLVFLGFGSVASSSSAQAETRTISLHHIHTGEDLTVTYKVNGRYDDEALNKINNLLRDWRESEATKMDPQLIDLLWEVHREVGGKGAIWIVCGYRSPQTNSMLRRRSSGVAQFSQHMLGKAIDFYIPGVPLEQLREAGLRAQRGGVGFYPTSGAPFVHLDTGSVRHWPRMPEEQLVAVLAKGQVGSRSGSDGQSSTSRMPSFLARLFGGGKDEEEDTASAATAKPAARAPAKSAVVTAAAETRVEKGAAVPLPQAKPARAESYQTASAVSKPVVTKSADRYEIASAGSEIVAQPVRLAQATEPVAPSTVTVSANDVINERGYWRGLPDAVDQPPSGNSRPAASTPRRAATVASAEPASSTPWPLADRGGSEPLPNTLAYAAQPASISTAQPASIATARAVPLPFGTPRSAAALSDAAVTAKRNDDRLPVATATAKTANVVRAGDRFDEPWMRALIVSPSAHSFLHTTQLGATDFRNLGPYLLKPAATMMMTFSNDPHRGMTSDKFDGNAVVFMSTATFSTASLR